MKSIITGVYIAIFSSIAQASRYEPDPSDSGGGYLLWIPLILAVLMYNKFEDSGQGKLAAVVGGLAGVAFIYFFPLLAVIIVTGLFLLLIIGKVLDW